TDVVRDMQQKTGQKCTAIRRVIVPQDKVERVIEALSERLATIKVGNPAREEVTMGPLATAQQQKDVAAGVKLLAEPGAAGEAKIVYRVKDASAIGVPAGKGFFHFPTLLRCDAPESSSKANLHEVFGPVATVMAYDGTAQGAKKVVAMGGGGLVSSVYSD